MGVKQPMRNRSEEIVCLLCGWRPKVNTHGGVRWKLLAQHYETHFLSWDNEILAKIGQPLKK